MRKIVLLFALISIILVSGCITGKTGKVTCNRPYIQVGTECCLDTNDNGICDKDEESRPIIKTVTTTQPPTTTQKVGKLNVRNEFMHSCRDDEHPDWCKIRTYDTSDYGATNEITIYTTSSGAKTHRRASIGTWVTNIGDNEIKDISTSFVCQQPLPRIPIKPYFWCPGCSKGCSCPTDESYKIDYLKQTDGTTFWIDFERIDELTYSFDLDCSLKIFSREPHYVFDYKLLFHFVV